MPVTRAAQLAVGTPVAIVLKEDQATGRQVQGVVGQILTAGDHPRGIKVRLRDGRVGRVQRLLGAADIIQTNSTTTSEAIETPVIDLGRRLGGSTSLSRGNALPISKQEQYQLARRSMRDARHEHRQERRLQCAERREARRERRDILRGREHTRDLESCSDAYPHDGNRLNRQNLTFGSFLTDELAEHSSAFSSQRQIDKPQTPVRPQDRQEMAPPYEQHLYDSPALPPRPASALQTIAGQGDEEAQLRSEFPNLDSALIAAIYADHGCLNETRDTLRQLS